MVVLPAACYASDDYRALAGLDEHGFTFGVGALLVNKKRLEPVLVTLTNASEVFPLFQHAGTEMLYMLEGVMVYGHGESEYTLRPGDSLLLDGEGLHGPHELVRLPIRFLAITAYPDDSDS